MLRVQRMKKEMQMLMESPPYGISCYPTGDDISQFEAKVLGGEDTPYFGGVFKLHIELPERYPFEPPKVVFVTPIYHPNIDSAGRICMDTLKMPPKGTWKPCMNLINVLTSVQLLMANPNAEDALMADIADELKHSPELFRQKAIQYTQQHAYHGVVQPKLQGAGLSMDGVQAGDLGAAKRPYSAASDDESSPMDDITNKKLKS